MKQHPLLMKGPLVRATLEGRKTVTRRLDTRWLKAKPCDLIWVKETWRTVASLDRSSASKIAQSATDAGYRRPWAPIEYVADSHRDNWLDNFDGQGEPKPGRTRVSIHMPKWASRLWLEVVTVRAERLQDITEEDARREGIFQDGAGAWRGFLDEVNGRWTTHGTAREAFRDLWWSIHGNEEGHRWDDSPTVVRIEFKRAERPALEAARG